MIERWRMSPRPIEEIDQELKQLTYALDLHFRSHQDLDGEMKKMEEEQRKIREEQIRHGTTITTLIKTNEDLVLSHKELCDTISSKVLPAINTSSGATMQSRYMIGIIFVCLGTIGSIVIGILGLL